MAHLAPHFDRLGALAGGHLDELASVWTTPSGPPTRPDPARAELYAAARAGRPAKLTELPIRYTDYVAWQEADLQSESAQRSEAWWKHQLAALPRLDLPMTRTPPRAPTPPPPPGCCG